MFRNYDAMAAAGRAAVIAYRGYGIQNWDEIDDEQKGVWRQFCMAELRGEPLGFASPIEEKLFGGVVRQIQDFNRGQGGLAIERITDLGQQLVDRGLVDPANPPFEDIVSCALLFLPNGAEKPAEPPTRQ